MNNYMISQNKNCNSSDKDIPLLRKNWKKI